MGENQTEKPKDKRREHVVNIIDLYRTNKDRGREVLYECIHRQIRQKNIRATVDIRDVASEVFLLCDRGIEKYATGEIKGDAEEAKLQKSIINNNINCFLRGLGKVYKTVNEIDIDIYADSMDSSDDIIGDADNNALLDLIEMNAPMRVMKCMRMVRQGYGRSDILRITGWSQDTVKKSMKSANKTYNSLLLKLQSNNENCNGEATQRLQDYINTTVRFR